MSADGWKVVLQLFEAAEATDGFRWIGGVDLVRQGVVTRIYQREVSGSDRSTPYSHRRGHLAVTTLPQTGK